MQYKEIIYWVFVLNMFERESDTNLQSTATA